MDGLTHVNFAFASIEPGTFEIITMDSATEAELFQRTADIKTLKSGNADLEVFVAIGMLCQGLFMESHSEVASLN